MKKKFSYQQLFQRNYGYFSNSEIKRIRKLRIAIAGAGGLGGHIAISLARLGVGYIRLADPELFEPHNINRQYGSDINSIGKNKAKVVAQSCKGVNPFIKTDVWEKGVNEENMGMFLKNIDVAVDVIEYFQPDIELALNQEARKKGIWVFTGQVAGSTVSATAFSPRGISFKKLFYKNGQFDILAATLKMFPIFSEGVTLKKIKHYLNSNTYIPAYTMPAAVISNLIVEQLISKEVRNQKPLAIAPKYFGLDIHNLRVAIR